MPTFCRHNRFIERCPICRNTLPGQVPSTPRGPGTERGPATRGGTGSATRRRRSRAEGLRVHREGRAADDGFRSPLVPGLRASADAERLADEIAFAGGRLLGLEEDPPGLYGEIRAMATGDPERATWACFLSAYLSPLEGEDPFAGIRTALAAIPAPPLVPGAGASATEPGQLPDLADVPLGPRSSHDRARGPETLVAYAHWLQRAGQGRLQLDAGDTPGSSTGLQAVAFGGDAAWSPTRRFERLFERLALPGLARAARYDLLVTLGRLRLYDLSADALHLGGGRGQPDQDQTLVAAKRVFGIGDPLLLERRAASLAQAASLPIEALDLALANWSAPQRATLGFPPETSDHDALELARDALGL